MTPSLQGEAVRDALHRLDHPTADEVFTEVRKHLPRVALGTVYRNLDQLVAHGEAAVRSIGGQRRYDPNTDRHAHLHCDRCDRLFDLDYADEDLDRLRQAAEKVGFQVDARVVELQGLCRACNEEKPERPPPPTPPV
ncbi:MAG: transcriptional repressor [Euryarchaeota archaeon]|nr:transcriptional repressor [Euryarchaeota archaeon]